MASSSTRETYLERALRAEYKELLVRLLSADLYHKAFAITKEFAKLLDDQPPLLTNYTDVGSRADQKWAELKAECASWTQRAKVLAASGNLAKVGRLLSDVGRSKEAATWCELGEELCEMAQQIDDAEKEAQSLLERDEEDVDSQT